MSPSCGHEGLVPDGCPYAPPSRGMEHRVEDLLQEGAAFSLPGKHRNVSSMLSLAWRIRDQTRR
eukprot:CAMPEP_0195584056 /NCGR_PEP_ID=MMETSP0814-20130614/25198_1 /TAXON_ID=97485 /ORGANISM="Prymnesium parvum, Strain Texoma1" /LENGTH=63 /DNA_ID=CAMNT_0040722015 /DNA_START=91 /DNA_END=282 /DNA_ORIENTATION=-